MPTRSTPEFRSDHIGRESLPGLLRPYVLDVYEAWDPNPPTPPYRFPMSALVTPLLNVTFSGRFVMDLDGGTVMPPELLSGPQPEAYSGLNEGVERGFYVVFAPAGPLALMGVRRYWRGGPAPVPALAELVRPTLADSAHAYTTALFKAPNLAARFTLTVDFLTQALADAPEADLREAAFLGEVVEAIDASSGTLRVEALAKRFGISPATLRRRFAVLGISAKRFSEIVRYRHAHAFLVATPGATWVEAVERFQYADQAHFVRAYHRYSGGPPTQWAPAERNLDRRLGIDGTTASADELATD
jgi:AraC-like DNA-binding protein